MKTINLPAFQKKLTKDCLMGDMYDWRDKDIDIWLPKTQPETKAMSVTIHESTQGTFEEMFTVALEGGVLEKHLFTLQQIENLIERHEAGEDVGLRTDGWGNYFPVIDADGSVSVVNVYRYGGRWNRRVNRLGDDDVCDAGPRLGLSNTVPLRPSVPSLGSLEARVKKLESLFAPQVLNQ